MGQCDQPAPPSERTPERTFVQEASSKRKPVRAQAADWVLRLEAAPSDDALRKEFELWLEEKDSHRAEYQKVRHAWAGMGRIPRDFASDVAGSAAVVQIPPRRRRGVRWLAAGAALAAACLAFVLFPVIQKHMLADYVTGTAELREIVLPDGSVAHLDAGSAIAVDFAGNRRAITLVAGQAFFSVVRDRQRPFTVQADEVAVTVTGTAFDVRKTSDSVSVAVQSGTVEVSTADRAEPDRLTLGQSLVFDRRSRTVSRREVPATEVASWRSRRMIFHDASFADVVEELGRHMPGAIVVRDTSLNRQAVSGIFDLTRPQEALEGLAVSQRATITRITPYLTVVSAP
jgi:transmembrane sensor